VSTGAGGGEGSTDGRRRRPRIRSGSRRVDAKPGAMGGREGKGGNETGPRGQVAWWLAPLYRWV
jgi:hypothetical protein